MKTLLAAFLFVAGAAFAQSLTIGATFSGDPDSMEMLYGTGAATSSVAGVLTVAGSLNGAFGSQFRTQLQLFNPSSSPINGTLVYHPANTAGSSADPSLPYNLAPGRVAFFSDVVASMNQTGLGSIDVVVPAGQSGPIAFARVYNDGGSAGTTGLSEDLVRTTGDDRVMTTQGFLITPPDPSKTRFNIGVRTLSQGATLLAVVRDGGVIPGTPLATVTKTYPPNWFEQASASDFFGTAVGEGLAIQIYVTAGSAIIYGSTTDNVTNDPAAHFMSAEPDFIDLGRKPPSSLSHGRTGTALSINTRVMTVAGSANGAFGSKFRTDLELYNPSLSPLTGTLVFHPAGAAASPTDPSLPYLLTSGRVTVLGDIVANMGQTGIGSIDLIPPVGQNAPIVVTRIYNDAGSAGTTGLTEELIGMSFDDTRVSYGETTGYLLTPPDPAKARFNIGIRTLDSGATVTATLKDGATGATLATVTKSYLPNWFEQTPASTLFGMAIGGNNVVQIAVARGGEAIIYGSTIDNTSNDPDVQFVNNGPPVP